MISRQYLFDKYLELLEIEKSSPDFFLLKKIVRAHLLKVPFENISKLLYKKQGMKNIPDLETFLYGIEKFNFGGTCYPNNYYLYCLLKYLGFNVRLCGADMKNPDVHIVNIVKIEYNEYLVDGGYAAPFWDPIPADLKMDYSVTLGKEKFLIKPKDETGRITVEQHYDGKLQHWYSAKPQARKIEDFGKVIEDSYSDSAVFMNAVRITKFTGAGSLVLKNLYLTENTPDNSRTIKISFNDIPLIIEKNSESRLMQCRGQPVILRN